MALHLGHEDIKTEFDRKRKGKRGPFIKSLSCASVPPETDSEFCQTESIGFIKNSDTGVDKYYVGYCFIYIIFFESQLLADLLLHFSLLFLF